MLLWSYLFFHHQKILIHPAQNFEFLITKLKYNIHRHMEGRPLNFKRVLIIFEAKIVLDEQELTLKLISSILTSTPAPFPPNIAVQVHQILQQDNLYYVSQLKCLPEVDWNKLFTTGVSEKLKTALSLSTPEGTFPSFYCNRP
jgi:hypothetical protein